MTNSHRHIIAVLLLIISLFAPPQAFVYACLQNFPASAQTESYHPEKLETPSEECPCQGETDSDCCDTVSCSCPCHAQLPQHIGPVYSPTSAIQGFSEPQWSFPQVYLPIFVPPQNHA